MYDTSHIFMVAAMALQDIHMHMESCDYIVISAIKASTISINDSTFPSICYTVMYIVMVGARVGLGLV